MKLYPKNYRPDIDGLRALAILAVVIFHAFPNKLPGGFIGVDIFFVISGFLISNHILKDLELGKFSFFDFYSRRISRIFPALLLMLTVLLAFSWFFLMPDDYASLGKNTVAGIAFVSNFTSLHDSGYFDASSLQKPLLHLWSLGIEEQFYILWPILLFLVRKIKNGPFIMTVFLFVPSFLFNIYLVKNNQSSAFYLPFTRFWELLIGCFLGVRNVSNKPKDFFLFWGWV